MPSCIVGSGRTYLSLDESNNNACIMTSSMKGCPLMIDCLLANDFVHGSGLWHVPIYLTISAPVVLIEPPKEIEVTREHRGAFDGASMH